MAEKKKDRKKLAVKLRNKYRLVILNDDTFEEKLSLKLSRLNVFVITGIMAIFLIGATTLLIAFTPLREYIPGYSSTALKRKAYELALTTDSLENQLNYNRRYMVNMKKIISGKPPINFSDTAVTDSVVKVDLKKDISHEDSILRKQVEEEERYTISNPSNARLQKTSINFYSPLKGLVSNNFNLAKNHLGIDVVAEEDEVIKAAQDGIVIFSEWTAQTGNVLVIQHANNFISVYKHNSSLLKEQGEVVKAGEPVAIIGNTGKFSSGPHLHFELWYDGNAVDPQSFISF